MYTDKTWQQKWSSSSSYSATALLLWPWLPLQLMPIPLYPVLCSPLFHTELPLPLLPSNFPSKIFFTDLVSFILITCPSHSNLRIFITVTISWDLCLVINSVLVLITGSGRGHKIFGYLMCGWNDNIIMHFETLRIRLLINWWHE